jgi:hypothetical protein
MEPAHFRTLTANDFDPARFRYLVQSAEDNLREANHKARVQGSLSILSPEVGVRGGLAGQLTSGFDAARLRGVQLDVHFAVYTHTDTSFTRGEIRTLPSLSARGDQLSAYEYFERFPKDRYQTGIEIWRLLQSANIKDHHWGKRKVEEGAKPPGARSLAAQSLGGLQRRHTRPRKSAMLIV